MRGARGIEYSRVGDDTRQPLIMYRRLRVNGELVHAAQLPHSANLALRLAQVQLLREVFFVDLLRKE